MYSHVMLGANDLDKSKAFYDAVLAVLGYKPGVLDQNGRYFYITDTGIFAITKPIDGEPAGNGNGTTIGFAAKTSAEVDAWHAAGIANGGITCEDPPGIRENSHMKLYLAYLRDPAGNKVCAMYRLG
ncbi:MAG: VOC family protein [Spongiibacteraceae bacterium]